MGKASRAKRERREDFIDRACDGRELDCAEQHRLQQLLGRCAERPRRVAPRARYMMDPGFPARGDRIYWGDGLWKLT